MSNELVTFFICWHLILPSLFAQSPLETLIQKIQVPEQAESLLISHGYLSAQCNYDSLYKRVICDWGPRYFLTSIVIDTIHQDTEAVFSPQGLSQILYALISSQQAKGMFFFSLDTVIYEFMPMKDSLVQVRLLIQTRYAYPIQIDSFFISKDESVPKFFLRYLGIKEKRIYLTPALLETLKKRVERSPYYQLQGKIQVYLHSDSVAWLHLPLKRKSQNSFDGTLGVIPPQPNTKKWTITAILRFGFINLFNLGEQVQLNYERLPNSTQRFFLQLRLPYMLPVGFQGEFDLFKQDTSFLNRNLQLGITYPISSEFHLYSLLEWRFSNVLNTKPYRTIRWPPPKMLDMRKRLYGIGFILHPFLDSFNPIQGWTLSTNYRTGYKLILRNPGLDSLEYGRLPLRQNVHEGYLSFKHYFPIRKSWLIGHTRLQAYLLNTPFYFDNELQQVGGAQTLRGFRERQFFSSAYAFFTLEPRIRLDEETYLGIFAEGGYLQYRFLDGPIEATYPYTLGLTMGLKTRSGYLILSYGVGTIYPQPLQWLRGQVHLQLNTFF